MVVAYWDSFAGKSVKRQYCKICHKSLKENHTLNELCAKNAIDHYQDAHGITLQSNSRLGAWEYNDK